MIYYKIQNGVAIGAQTDITGFPGLWVEAEEGFGANDLYEDGTWSHPIVEINEDDERQWRNDELNATDLLSILTDYPLSENLMAYRQALRDWPSTDDFPANRPLIT